MVAPTATAASETSQQASIATAGERRRGSSSAARGQTSAAGLPQSRFVASFAPSDQRFELGPGHLGVDATAEAAVCAGR